MRELMLLTCHDRWLILYFNYNSFSQLPPFMNLNILNPWRHTLINFQLMKKNTFKTDIKKIYEGKKLTKKQNSTKEEIHFRIKKKLSTNLDNFKNFKSFIIPYPSFLSRRVNSQLAIVPIFVHSYLKKRSSSRRVPILDIYIC